MWGIASVLWGYLQYCGGCSVQWGITSVQWGIASVLWRVFSTLGALHQYMWEITSVQWGITSVLWRVFSTVGDTFSTMGDTLSTVGDNISTTEVAQYSGDKDLKYYEFSKNLEIFSRANFTLKSDRPHHRPQLLTTADIVKDLGYKNLVLGKILL